jgi:tetratricopeptide (TPR) repeat protein
VENRWLAKAALAPDFSAQQINYLEKAFAAEPKNFDTTYAIGEAYRIQSHEGGEDYKDIAAKAMVWFQRGMKLNPWDGYNFLRYGWCLDWIGRQNESGPYFTKAEQLDPNGYFTMANIGLHYIDLHDFAAAKPWFLRSLELEYQVNRIARMYLPIVNRKLLEDATNEISAKLALPAQ